MLHLEVAQITLRLVVVEGNGQIIQEREHHALVEPEPFEQGLLGQRRLAVRAERRPMFHYRIRRRHQP